MDGQQRDRIIRMAWEDRTTFDEIREKTGFAEADVIKLMRKELKPSSFRMWRKRVAGRLTKHRKLLKAHSSETGRGKVSNDMIYQEGGIPALGGGATGRTRE